MLAHAVPAALAGLLALAGLAGCNAQPLHGDLSREWFQVGVGVYDRRQGRGDPVDDSFGPWISGGYDVVTGPVRTGFELGLGWARHDVALAAGDGEDPHLDVSRAIAGWNLAFDLGPLPFSVNGRTGFLWRDERQSDAFGIDNDQVGIYAGGSLTWWTGPALGLEPFFVWFRGDEDRREEVLVGLAARFHLDRGEDWGRYPY